TEIKTVPYVPLSHPFVERLIGTIRREYLDQTLLWTRADLEEKLLGFQHYYNEYRTHAGLDGRTPEPRLDADHSPFEFQLLSLEAALSRAVPNTGGRVIVEFARDRWTTRSTSRRKFVMSLFTRYLANTTTPVVAVRLRSNRARNEMRKA